LSDTVASRLPSRLRTLARAALGSFSLHAKARPQRPDRIIVLHELLLGDTLMLAPLLARLRRRYPEATIFITARPEIVPLFSGMPYGVHVLPFTERDPNALRRLAVARGCDLALVPGDNRYAATARALGAKWVVALADARAHKNLFVDQPIALPATPTDLGEIFASLAGQGVGENYHPGDWLAPAAAAFDAPRTAYALLHVGASTPLKYWPVEQWSRLAATLADRKIDVVLSAGPKEVAALDAIDPGQRYRRYAGTLDLTQLWSLIEHADVFVTLDTGVAHIAKLTGTPTVCLYGPGSAQLVGRGRFFVDAPFVEVTIEDFRCRDQRLLFKREIAWVRRCGRTLAQCSRPACMEAIGAHAVLSATERARAQAAAANSRATRV
jgi:ADP-heptose:LPS heptosyltransferase